MSLQIYDTMQRQKVAFAPRDPGRVSMYVCGPTVYDLAHLGHGRTALTYDVIRRYLEWCGYEVVMASNVTDIDDRIIAKATSEGRTEPEVAAEFTGAYDADMDRLGILAPHSRPHATQFVDGMIAIIAELIDKGRAYEVPGKGVYFSVDRLEGYGLLAGRDIDQLLDDAGSRVEIDPDKRSPLDFALWKAAKPGEPTWDTPWGPGRPGWHTECVAMSLEALGEGFDIHGGGDDLCFPHHQNEWAQVVAAGKEFARHWVHSAMVNIGGEKMSKSLDNFTTLREALDASGARAFRLLALQTHYRSTMEMSPAALSSAAEAVKRVDAFARRMAAAGLDLTAPGDLTHRAYDSFRATMDDDFGTPGAVDLVFTLIRSANAALDSGDAATAETDGRVALDLLHILGISDRDDSADSDRGASSERLDHAAIEALVAERSRARADKDFAASDRIRDELAAAGVIVEDTASGTVWHRG